MDDEPMRIFDDPEKVPACPICGSPLLVRTLPREFYAVSHIGFEATCSQCAQKCGIIYSYNVQEGGATFETTTHKKQAYKC